MVDTKQSSPKRDFKRILWTRKNGEGIVSMKPVPVLEGEALRMALLRSVKPDEEMKPAKFVARHIHARLFDMDAI